MKAVCTVSLNTQHAVGEAVRHPLMPIPPTLQVLDACRDSVSQPPPQLGAATGLSSGKL